MFSLFLYQKILHLKLAFYFLEIIRIRMAMCFSNNKQNIPTRTVNRLLCFIVEWLVLH